MTPPATGPSTQGAREFPQMTPPQAFWRGVATTLTLAVPAALLNLWLVEGDKGDSRTPLAMLLWIVILLGAGAGGWATIRLSEQAPLSYAAGSAALAYVVVQGFGVIRRVVAGDHISWLGYPFLMLLMATCGMLGGMFARRWTQQNTSSTTGSSSGGSAPK